MVLHGIRSCDGCRKARRWLARHGAEYRFHDLRVDGLSRTMLARWLAAADWQTLLNRRSAGWRALPEVRRRVRTAAQAAALMLEEPTLIKRPVLESGTRLLIGFNAARWARELA